MNTNLMDYCSLCFLPFINDNRLSFKYFYLCQFSFYVSSCITHLTLEVRRKDFVEMLLHHAVTAVLIGGSYWAGYAKFE